LKTITDKGMADACDIDAVVSQAGVDDADHQALDDYRLANKSWVLEHLSELQYLWRACRHVPEIAAPLTRSTICSSLLAQVTNANEGPRETGLPIAVVAAFAAGVLAII
jgi:hypothetical protein